ncbi:peptidoglycan-binding domain-containing protein [Pyxidicoccus sp. 3LFB2]
MPPPKTAPGSSAEKFQAMEQESREAFSDVDAESPTLPCEKDDVWVRIAFKDDFGEPYADVAFVLEVQGQQWKGRTTARGVVEHVVPAGATEGVLKLWFDGEEEGDTPFTYSLALGAMDPVALETGQQSRLENLGLFGLEGDGPASGTFQDALYSFQEWAGLEETGTLDEASARKLQRLYSPLGSETLPPPSEEDSA